MCLNSSQFYRVVQGPHLMLSKTNNVNIYFFLLQFLCYFHHLFWIIGDGTTNKYNNPCFMIFSTPVFKCQHRNPY